MQIILQQDKSKCGVATKMAWGKADSNTVTTAIDLQTLTVEATKFKQILDHTIPTGACTQSYTFNNDTTTSYALRYSGNGGTLGTGVNRSNAAAEWDPSNLDRFNVSYMSDISGEETLWIQSGVFNTATGAGTAPSRYEEVWKWDDTAQITEMDSTNASAGSFDTDSNLSVLGSDLTPAAAVPFPANVQVGSRAEITDTRKMYHKAEEYKVHSFTSGGTFAVTGSGDVEYLVVGGGGGGFTHGTAVGSAGGAGAFRTATGFGVTAQSYSITVGAGGAVSTQGNDSIFSTITSNGGAEGVTVNTNGATNGNASGSGAGSGGGANTGGAGGTYGNNGGNTHSAYWYSSAGGGGSSTVGGNSSGGVNNGDGASSAVAGNGGDGTSSSITGSAVTYSAGGGGATYDTTGTKGTGGSSGIGGDGGGSGVTNGTAGDANTGSGGGGCTYSGAGGTGGSGIVIIKYSTSSGITATGGTITTVGGAWSEEGT